MPLTVRERTPMLDHGYFANPIWQIADLLRGPYRPPQYERVMLPMTVLRRFDCVLAKTKDKVLAAHKRRSGGRLKEDALDTVLNRAAGQRFHNTRRSTSSACRATPTTSTSTSSATSRVSRATTASDTSRAGALVSIDHPCRPQSPAG